MTRPQNKRIIHEPPLFSEFGPVGLRKLNLEQVLLTLDEFESFRLADQLGLSHAEAAEEMEISRSTFTRLIEKARKKIADFIIQGKLLTIGGGNIHFRNNIIRCQHCGHTFKSDFIDFIKECPSCHSNNLVNLAGRFGHGKCCNTHHKSIHINQKHGGNYART